MEKKIKLFLFLIILIFASLSGYLIYSKLTCQRLACLSFTDSDKYKIKELYEENKYIFRALYKKGNILLRFEVRPNTSSSEAEQATQAQLSIIRGLFEDAAAPYPGEISKIITCSQKYKPEYLVKQQNGIKISYFTGFVNERLVFGSCTDDQAVYHDTMAMFYCDTQKKLYQLEIIVPRKDYQAYSNKYQKILDSIACKN